MFLAFWVRFLHFIWSIFHETCFQKSSDSGPGNGSRMLRSWDALLFFQFVLLDEIKRDYFSLETDSFMIGGFYTDPFYTLDVLNKKILDRFHLNRLLPCESVYLTVIWILDHITTIDYSWTTIECTTVQMSKNPKWKYHDFQKNIMFSILVII